MGVLLETHTVSVYLYAIYMMYSMNQICLFKWRQTKTMGTNVTKQTNVATKTFGCFLKDSTGTNVCLKALTEINFSMRIVQ